MAINWTERRVVVTGLGVVTAEAQQPKKGPRIGYLSAGSTSANLPRMEAFRQGLRDLGYIEGTELYR